MSDREVICAGCVLRQDISDLQQENTALKEKLLEIKRRVTRMVAEHCYESPLGHNRRLEEKITIILKEIGER